MTEAQKNILLSQALKELNNQNRQGTADKWLLEIILDTEEGRKKRINAWFVEAKKARLEELETLNGVAIEEKKDG